MDKKVSEIYDKASLSKQKMDLLIDLVSGKLTLQEYFKKEEPLNIEFSKYFKKINENELGDSLGHELEHKKVWDKYGISSIFVEDLSTNHKATVDINFDTITIVKGWDVSKYLQIAKEVAIAPYKTGYPFLRCQTDLLLHEILSGNIKTYPPNREDITLLNKLYSC
jgi:hypothetical protein